MRRFAELYTRLDASTATSDKVDALARYFADAPATDAAWAANRRAEFTITAGPANWSIPTP
jgi:hypothetical protein